MSGRQKKQWLVRKLYKLLKFAHATYFYFMPLLVPVMAYFSNEIHEAQELLEEARK